MFSQTRKIVFVTGTAEGDRRFEHEAKRTFEPWRDKLEFQYTSDRSVEEILQLVASLPPRSIVIYSNVFSDKTGRTFIPREVGKMVAKAANAPVFCLWDTLIGGGVIGGSLLSFEAEGTYAANVVLDMLNGKILLTKPVTTLPTSKTYMFDSQQLKRWGVNESILPEGSVLVNRVPTLWEQHKGLVIGSIVVLLAQTMLAIGLLIQRYRKIRAEESLRQKTEELDQFFNVNLDLLCIANTEGYFLRLNPAWEKILGYTREELMAKRFLEFVHPDDLHRTREAVSTLVSHQKVLSFENRYRCKDGTYRLLEWSSAPSGDMIYAAARDITERKRAEEEAVQHVRNMEYLSETAMGFVELPAEKDIYWFIAEKLRQLTGDAIYVSVNAYDQKTRRIEGRALLADDQDMQAILKTLGTDVRGMSFALSEEAWNGLISGKLVQVPGGIYELLLGESPKAACDALEKLAGIGEIFVMGFASKGDLYGNAIIIMPEGSRLGNRDVVETFLRQAGVALQRRLADEALKKSEERYRMLVETMTEGLGVQDENGLFTYVNDRLCQMLGYFHGEIIGRPVAEFLDEANQSILREQIEKQGKGDHSPYEITWTRADGRKMMTLVSPKPIFDSEGQFRGSFAVITDITELKGMQETIRKSAEEWQTTFDSIQDLVMILDPEFKLVRVNAATLSFFNLPLERVLGKHCYDLMHGTSEPVGTCPLAKMLETKTHEETELYDEKINVWLHVSVDPVFGDKGQIIRVIHTVKDVTEQKRAESEASRARRELLRMDRLSRMGELTASLAHELNQPLAAILSNAQAGLRFIQSGKINLDELQEILQDVIQDDQRAGNVIRSLRSMMKREEVQRNLIILNNVLNDVIQIFRTESIFRNVHVETEFDGSLPPVLGDKVQLQQVVLNLILNAADAMSDNPPEYRQIILRTGVKDDRIRVTVRDFGPGIDQEGLERIFEPFFTTKGTGLGMGLSVCRTIVEAHEGRIWAENNSDRGATFVFELPVISNK
jgi:PAS domain S-box-containing protein